MDSIDPGRRAGRIEGSFVLSSGRSGSTMLSDILASHPEIASLSEFFTFLGTRSLLPGRVSGARYWQRLSRQTPLYRQLFTAETAPREFLYPGTGGRFPEKNVPPILATTLPHLTDLPDALLGAAAVRALARSGELEVRHAPTKPSSNEPSEPDAPASKRARRKRGESR